jgi:hypothetical protein
VAIKFDLVDNAGEGSNSVGVFTGGATPSMPGVSLDGTGIDLHSGHPFRANIAYDGADLALTLTDTTIPDRTWTGHFAVDIPNALGASTGFVGFTAGTWDLFTRQTIKSLTYAEDTPPAPVRQRRRASDARGHPANHSPARFLRTPPAAFACQKIPGGTRFTFFFRRQPVSLFPRRYLSGRAAVVLQWAELRVDLVGGRPNDVAVDGQQPEHRGALVRITREAAK